MRKAVNHLRDADPVLASIIERVGRYKMQYAPPTFHNLCRSIVYQQLSGKAAATIFGRVTAVAGDPLKPDSLLELSLADLRALGLSQQKATYVRDLAARTGSGEIRFERFPRLRDAKILEELTQVKGIGVWTVQMFLMFALRRPNVLPTGDLGIRNAIKRAYKLHELPGPREVERIAGPWHPYCSIASWYLWRSLEQKDPETRQG
jgi:DNA-3-methyladenine glycosylase II